MNLNVYCRGMLVGKLDMRDGEPFYGFAYDGSYLSDPSSEPLSLSLPLCNERYSGRSAMPFFEGLLPEGDSRASLAQRLGISERSPAKLLRVLGKDCAGDVAVLEEDDPYQPPAIDAYAFLEGGLAAIAENPFEKITELRTENRLSLAGGQEKIALYHDARSPIGEGWYVPLEGSPSTHIVKPQLNDRYPLLALNEFLCMKLAEKVGLSVAETYYLDLPTPMVVVERFDREPSGVNSSEGLVLMRRIRQEDACQALGRTSAEKYQQDGGPGIRELNSILLHHAENYLKDRVHLTRLVVFNYLIGNCDAHAKNFSFLLRARSAIRIAPAYDLISTSVYGRGFGSELSRMMGMRIGSHANIDNVTHADFETLAEDLDMRTDDILSYAREVSKILLDTKKLAKDLALDASLGSKDADVLVQRLFSGIEKRSSTLYENQR